MEEPETTDVHQPPAPSANATPSRRMIPTRIPLHSSLRKPRRTTASRKRRNGKAPASKPRSNRQWKTTPE